MKLKHAFDYSVELGSIPQNTIVSFKVSAVINNKEVPMKYVLTATTLKFSIKAVTMTDSLIRINWTNLKNAQYYYLYYKSGNSSTYYSFVDSANTKMKLKWYSDFSSELNHIPANTNVSFKVSAIINGKEVPMSYTLNTKTKPVTNPTPLPATGNFMSYLSYKSSGLYLYSNDGQNKYLGQLTSNQYDTDGIFNQFGTYGSKYGTDSIWNQYGTYGSQYSSYSVMNPYTSFPPKILDGAGNFIGYLTSNDFKYPAYNPVTILLLLKNAGY
ncbi:hypothetical protein [Neobacillus sp. PS3-40]|uniref:hypothetical protein n=1 Tax=Neobacillus sp. PS3-40 TaxID=3070679 RepID=UPI0027DF63E9|nr:hypothetical protein [Neobacillus sp. PS3-40]WML46144.1 hypothetical protein RCG20_09740 [Neobacillus sp. PS3-40]